MVAAWAGIAAARKHPRSGAALVPAVTRLDLFLEAWGPVPAPDMWWRYVPGMRRALRELIRNAFPAGTRYQAPYDVGGATRGDPAQKASDPRLWLVVAPVLPAELETMIRSTFLRAEPYARVARLEAAGGDLEGWLGREVDALIAGEGLVTEGLVADLAGGGPGRTMVNEDAKGVEVGRSQLFDLVSGLEEMYATREELGPGQEYNRFHSHSGSEELYIVLAGEGIVRVNERVLPIRAGQAFGKPRGYDCNTQIVNTGATKMVLLDVGTTNLFEVDVWRYPDHGEISARIGGQRVVLVKP